MTGEQAAEFGDAFEEAAQAASPTSMAEAATIVAKMAQLDAEVKVIEASLAAKNKELNEYKANKVPEVMKKVNQALFVIADGPYAGVKCEVKDFVSGSLPKAETSPEARDAALAYLTDNGGESLIKSELTVSFEKSQHNEALSLLAELKEQGYVCSFDSAVHAGSLQAWARERIKKGEEVNAEVLNLFIGTAAKLTWPKEKKR